MFLFTKKKVCIFVYFAIFAHTRGSVLCIFFCALMRDPENNSTWVYKTLPHYFLHLCDCTCARIIWAVSNVGHVVVSNILLFTNNDAMNMHVFL